MNNNQLSRKIEELENKILSIEQGKSISFKNVIISSMKRWNSITGMVMALVFTSVIVFGSQVLFTDGTIISAEEVNNNFTELYNSVSSIKELPVGTVIDWWRPDTSYEVPEGFAICDGSEISDTDSPFNGETLPDLNNLFIRGTTSVDNIGNTGGSASHSHTTPAHNHEWASFSSADWYSFNSAGSKVLIRDWSNGMDTDGSGDYPLSKDGTASMSMYTDNDSTATEDTEHSPPYYSMLKIMKIK